MDGSGHDTVRGTTSTFFWEDLRKDMGSQNQDSLSQDQDLNVDLRNMKQEY
jgi:hypothetical protein